MSHSPQMHPLSGPIEGVEQALAEAKDKAALLAIWSRVERIAGELDDGVPASIRRRAEAAHEETYARLEQALEPWFRALAAKEISGAEVRAQLEKMRRRAQSAWVSYVFGIAGPPSRERPTPIPYAPTPVHVILNLIDRIPITAGDIFVDVGAGLGHVINLVALLTGAECIGIEIEPSFVARADAIRSKLGVDNARFRREDVFDADLDGATVIFLFAPFREETVRALLEKKIHPLKAGTRVCTFGMSEQIDARLGGLTEETGERGLLPAGVRLFSR